MTRRFACLVLTSPFVVAAAVAACSSSSDSNGGGGNQPVADVSIVPGASLLESQAYSPDTITVSLSGAASVTVTWRNDESTNSGILHTVTDTTAANAFNTGNINPGAVKSLTFGAAGSYPYKCNNHPGMRGLVLVQP
jgi:plastocyanin